MPGRQVVIDPVIVDRARGMLERAHMLFGNADAVPDAPERFRQYYLAALRAAGAALAVFEPRVVPVRARRGSRSAWKRIALVIPELAGAAQRMEDRSSTRMNIEAGLTRTVDAGDLESLRREVLDLFDRAERLVVAYEQGKLAHQQSAGIYTA
ncbi:hypothetical protein GII30_14310 [Gordonia amarae]|uniref:SAV-6107-like HEPN domain-containing protein n=2 Tax=Gordonia amarae TaxID=36821 RepID=G7GPN1_9ACTN|nr:SAV_6107 family HEPN domain-containing protein [Gordonia amarae]MCS3879573.1 hypothetical protein [Gordonia amarae]QHN18032.1 hypothetical protein GII35_14625 [Gordonia amarae]QHN22552.1 hypothetical protein GII34_14365 [Gordonia amarae]QHN31419.1 hypothetical protein GII32_14475 [Gordonia amarae]QHN40163.1 hypothetical protein GII30_14310 [Gordonia amarae]